MRKVLILVSVSLFAGLVFVSQSDVAQAHYCDDHYANQAARENCWWRYENDRATAADARLAALSLPETPAAEANGFFCDTHYPLQANKENCWSV